MKRCVFKLGLFLLAGAIINIAVAWACAFWVNPLGHGFVQATQFLNHSQLDPDYGSLTVWRMQRAGAMDIKVNRWRGGYTPPVEESPLSLLPEWTGLREPSDAYKAGGQFKWARGGVGAEVALVEARGWPMLAMWVSHGTTVPSKGVWTNHGLNTPWMRPGNEMNGASYPIALPLRPLWLGFAVNTMIYAAMLWLLFTGTGVTRRRRRIKRGLCPACAYPVGSSDVCTECGKPIPGNPGIPGVTPRRGDGM